MDEPEERSHKPSADAVFLAHVAGYEQGKRDATQRIIEYLSEEAEIGVPLDIANKAGAGFHPLVKAVCKLLADAIDRGEHEKGAGDE